MSGCGGGTMEVKTTPNSGGPTVIVEKPSTPIIVEKSNPTVIIDKSGPSTETTRTKNVGPTGTTRTTETKTTTP